MSKRTDQLTPFTPETASRAGKRSAEVRRQRAIARQVEQAQDARTLATHLQTFADTFQRDDIGTHSAAVAAMILAKIAAGQVPIRHAADAAELLKVLHDMTRLEEGQSTSNILHGTIDSGAIIARIEELRGELTTGPNTSQDSGRDDHPPQT
jgi:hypothetical protein